MSNQNIKITKTEVLSNNWYVLRKITYDYLKKDGTWETQSREAYDRGNGATILLYNKENKTIILTQQFRMPTYLNGNESGMIIEACAGLLDKDNAEECIKRETEEETGYKISSVEKVFEVYMSPGSVTEIVHFFVAAYSKEMKINWSQFKTIAVIDSNIALECLALEQLPWYEIDRFGPILVLVAPTVSQEVDTQKNHARLGDHARRFSRLMGPLLGEQSTVHVRQSPNPKVELALADCSRVHWGSYPTLDPDEPDSRIVAQALHVIGPPQSAIVVVSQDIRPLHLAKQNGLRTHHIGENWLRPKEISESEKKAASLKRELEAMQSREPSLSLSIKTDVDSVVTHRIRDLTDMERKDFQDTILSLNLMPEQSHDPLGLGGTIFNGYDHTLFDRYQRWQEKVVPEFMRNFERKIELNFGQIEIAFRIENTGQVPAESLLIRLVASGGWLNDRYVLASPCGPHAPRIRHQSLLPNVHNQFSRPISPVGKHDFTVIALPKRSKEVRISCSDFRHGHDYEYKMIAWVDPWADKFELSAVVTASNLYGSVHDVKIIEKTVIESSASDLLFADSLKFRQPPTSLALLVAAKGERDYFKFEFDGGSSG